MSQDRNHYLKTCLLITDIPILQILNINTHLEVIITKHTNTSTFYISTYN